APGNYKLEVNCPDYEPLSDIVTVAKGQATERVAPLASKFATLRVGLGKQAGQDITVKLNGQVFPPRKVEAGQLVFEQVPVGKQTFSFIKSGFSEWTLEFDIRPGNNFVSATMEAETIAVMIQTQPHAEVYVDDEPKREASEAGELKLNLSLGEHKLRATLPGFEPAGQPLSLAREPRALTVPIPLTPIVEDADFSEEFDPRVKNWTPFPPAGWKFQTQVPLGVTLTGNAAGFVFNTTRPNRKLNFYRDFDLTMNARFIKGNGFAWIIRAKDENNYYLFELDRQRNQLLFYICENGVKRPLRTDSFTANLDDKEWFYPIKLTVRGNKFSHTIETPTEEKKLGGVFEDSTFSLGGVGLQAIGGAEVFLNQFLISKPEKKP
ncbi:MAG TPA: hypothetical protein PLD20_35155, partial [Blastocatellia bacterium]|nr:hypothetical protein [Blastocatellia bacterium]